MHADIPPWRNGPQQLWRWGNLGLTAHTNSRLHIHKKQPKKYSFCVLCFLFFSSTLTVYVRYVASEMENYLVLLFHLRVFIAFYRTAEAVLEGCSFGVKILHICGELGRDCLSRVWNRLVLAAFDIWEADILFFVFADLFPNFDFKIQIIYWGGWFR